MPMSTGTKRILAIVVVAVVIVGVVGVYILIQPPGYATPGAPSGVTRDQIIKIGILDDMTDITGTSCWNGAYLAVKEINAAGGITIGGTTYYLGLISENTYEAQPTLDITKGTAAATKILTVDGAQFIIGGFRTESLLAYLDIVMDNKTVFLGTGAATDNFTQNVIDNYAKYKYFFRMMPINSTMLGGETVVELLALKLLMQSPAPGMLNRTVDKWAVLREDLDWTKPMDAALKYYLPGLGYNASPAVDIAYPITATQTDFNSYMATIKSSGAQILIPIISAQGGSYMMNAYNSTNPKCLICGIDVPSQLDSFWTSSGKTCAYEIGMLPLVKTNKTPYSIPFWNHYVGNFSASPLYTGVGAYDAVNTLAWAIKNCSSLNSDNVVTALESIKTTNINSVGNSRVGVAGRLAFTRSHDLLEGYLNEGSLIMWSVTLWTQWGTDGKKHLISSAGILYPMNLINESLPTLPPWGIN